MRVLSLLLLCLYANMPSAQELKICFNYSCAEQATVQFNAHDQAYLNSLFIEADDAPSEREAIRLAIGVMSQVAGRQSPIRNDKAQNDNEYEVEGRMDCIDHSYTTTAYLQLLESHGWLQYHRVLDPVHRAPLLVNDHWSARIEETASGEQFAIDTWFFDNGQPASIFSLEEWLKGATPHG